MPTYSTQTTKNTLSLFQNYIANFFFSVMGYQDIRTSVSCQHISSKFKLLHSAEKYRAATVQTTIPLYHFSVLLIPAPPFGQKRQ